MLHGVAKEIKFACPICQIEIQVPDSMANQAGQCPKCATIITVPRPEPNLARPPINENPFAFLDQTQSPLPKSSVGTDEPNLPITVDAAYSTLMHRHYCQVHVEGKTLTVNDASGTALVAISQADAKGQLHFSLGHLKVHVPGKSKLTLTFEASKKLPRAIGRLRAWTTGLTGDAARTEILRYVTASALRVPLFLCVIQLLVTGGLFVTLVATSSDIHLLLALTVGIVGMVFALIAMLLKQTWGPLLAAIINVLGIVDTVIAILIVLNSLGPDQYLTGMGIAFVVFRIAILSTFVNAYFCGYTALRSAKKYAQR